MKLFCFFLFLLFSSVTRAQSIFIDPEDGFFDATKWLLEHRGFLPVPIIITEPAVGYGGGAALVFMSKNEDDTGDSERFITPTVTGVFGVGTENGTWAAGGFYVRNWDYDRWRYMGFAATASANLDFYGLPGFTVSKEQRFGYSLKGWGIFNDLRARIADSNFFLGGRYIYTDLNVSFRQNTLPAGLSSLDLENKNGGLSILASYDNRDNTMSPQSGVIAEYRYYIFSENLGGDLNYHKNDLDLQGFVHATDFWGFAARWLNNWVNGDAPFYAKPYINLRGIPKLRYQGDIVSSLEAEIRMNPHPRWEISVFGGAGRAAHAVEDLNSAATRATYGVGFRYLLARLLGFQMGLDLARGPEETVFYIQTGGAWLF